LTWEAIKTSLSKSDLVGAKENLVKKGRGRPKKD